MLLTALIWGVSFVLMKLALREIQPEAITLLRYLVASIGFGVFLLAGRRNLPSIPRRDWVRTIAAAATGVVAYGMLVAIGLQNSASSIASLINTTGPVFTLVLAGIFLNESLTRNRILGIAIAVCGVLLIIIRGSGETNLTVANVFGPFLVVVAVLSWSLYSILAKPLLQDYPAIPFTAYLMILGTLLMAPVALVTKWDASAIASPIVWIAAGFSGIGSTLIGQLLWNYALTILDVSEVSAYLYLVPLTTVITAITFLGEAVTIYLLLGGAIIVIGVALTNRARSARS